MRSQGAEHSVACGSVDTSTPSPAGWRPTHRHVKRGSLYRLVSSAVLQTKHPVGDNEFLALYQGEDGLFWVRPADEFKDGRFEPLPPADPGASGSTEPTTGSQKPDPERLIERLKQRPALIRAWDKMTVGAGATPPPGFAEFASAFSYALADMSEAAALLAAQQAELQRVKEERDEAIRRQHELSRELTGVRASYWTERKARLAAEASLREAVGVLEPFAKADLHEWSGRGAVAPFIDRSHFEAAAALRSRLTQHTPQTEEGTP